MRKLTEKQAQFLSQRFNASCTAPGVTNVTQMEMAVNDWLKELIAESAALHESVARTGYDEDIRCSVCSTLVTGIYAQRRLCEPCAKTQPEPERGTATPLPWKWDGYDLWHIGESYDSKEDPHRFTGITVDKHSRDSPKLKANMDLILKAVNRTPSALPVREQSIEWDAIEALAVEELCCDGSGECNVCKAIKAAKEILKLKLAIAGEKEE